MSLFDRVRDTTTGTGTGNLTLVNSAPTGFRTFGSVLSNNDRVYYCIAHQSANEWETGFGTYSTTGPALARTVVLASSNAGAAVNFSAGTKDVFITPPVSVFGNRLPEISITGTATATIDRMHVCSGTSADYTVTLPAAANNAGRRLWFRMATGLTRFVTLDGNASETIDGATTRVMWAGETAELLCDGSNWFKVAGKTIPMTCGMYKATDQAGVVTSTVTLINLDTTVSGDDNTGRMANSANKRINIVRSGNYILAAAVSYESMTGRGDCRIHKNGADLWVPNAYAGGIQLVTTTSTRVPLLVNDYIQLYAFQSSGSNKIVYGNASNSVLYATEVPSW